MKKLIIGIGLVLSACELVVDVKVPMESPRMTINCSFTQDSLWYANVTRSNYILDESYAYKDISDATLVLKENGIAVDTLHNTDFGNYYSSPGIVPKPNMQYELVGSAPGFEPISAQSALPPVRTMSGAEFTWRLGNGVTQDFNYTIDVTFTDDANTEDYYQFQLYVVGSWDDPQTGEHHEFEYLTYAYTDDPQLRNENVDDILFDDKTFNGKEVRLRIKARDYSMPDAKFTIVMRTMSKELYEYILTSELQQFTSGDPFAQPVRVHNNIKNGFGVFGGYQETKLTITP